MLEIGSVKEFTRVVDGEMKLTKGKLTAVYEYDENGNEIEETNLDKPTIITECNEKGLVVSEKFLRDGEIYWEKKMEYDDSGKLIHETCIDRTGKIDIEDFYKYDEKNRMVTKEMKYANIKTPYIYHYEYDLPGNVNHLWIEGEGNIQHLWFEYDFLENGSIKHKYRFDEVL